MEECYFFSKVAGICNFTKINNHFLGVFHVFKIVQMVPNRKTSHFVVQLSLDNLNSQGTLEKVRPIESSSFRKV